jgi:hypothetical protein
MNEFFKARRLEILIIVVVIALIGVTYALTKPANAPTVTGTNNQSVQQVANSDIQYQGQDGRSALDLLKVFHRVDTKETSYGPMIVGIDGLAPDSSHFWAFYVNGKLADVGADKYITKNSDQIEWKVESAQ